MAMRELREDDFIVSKTDTKGRILYCNKIFIDFAEYHEEELLQKPHNIIRHPDMPKAIFKLLWSEIPHKKEVFAFIVNRSKNGNDYWVYANITASLNEHGSIVDYYSVRRKPNKKALNEIIPLYRQMLEVEKSRGVDASFNILKDILAEKGVGYNEHIISLQYQ